MIWTSLHNFDHDRTEINDHNLKIEFDNRRCHIRGTIMARFQNAKCVKAEILSVNLKRRSNSIL